ncbi:MAG: DUF3192 domain-containing protein [Lentisphaeria bacterium]|nr:DUF3192 domain-containing protein [Lentisphaeria bacterium]
MKKIFYMLGVILLLSGCAAINPYKKAEINVENSKRLRVGMTKAQVLEIMGEPEKDESFNRPDLWYYYFAPNWIDGLITEDECFPLIFKDGKLIGWGNRFYSSYRLENEKRIPDLELLNPVPQIELKQ